MSTIQWQNHQPPTPKRGRSTSGYDQIAAELRARAGQWAIISSVSGDDPKSSKVGYTLPGFEALRSRGCMVAQRRNEGRGLDLWACWPVEESTKPVLLSA